jgi:general secretion pathway protein E
MTQTLVDPQETSSTVDDVIQTLLVSGALRPSSLERARRASDDSGERLDNVLRKLGLVSDDQMTSAWAEATGHRVIAMADFPSAPILADQLRPEYLRHAGVLPIALGDDRLTIALSDPLDSFSPAAIAAKTGLRVEIVLARPGELQAMLTRLYGDVDADDGPETAPAGALADDVERLRDLASDAPVIRIVNDIIDRAIELSASDIHLVANDLGTRIRFRIDGVLRDEAPPPPSLHAAIISRIKIMASLDIAERRLPQDGRIKMSWRGREVDLRIATMPHLHGEGAVLRILDRSSVTLDLDRLGFSQPLVEDLRKMLREPHGIFLVTGPTGSGKTTTLYAGLREIATPDRNIITVEDPIEYQLAGVNQIQINRRIGLDFASSLRAVLRQDPDIIMVGEIRDGETAAIANQAALTGHLVLATIHTNTAAASLPRLVDMGVEPYLLASTLRGAMAQRLVRRLCPHCSEPAGLSDTVIAHFGEKSGLTADQTDLLRRGARRPVGCQSCGGSGYRSRVAVADMMTMTDDIRHLLLQGAGEMQFQEIVEQSGGPTLRADAMAKVARGETSLDEALRVVGSA